jgi:hypothetical protein
MGKEDSFVRIGHLHLGFGEGATNIAPLPATMLSSVAGIQRITGCRTQLWISLITCPVVRSSQRRLSASVAITPSWTVRFAEQSLPRKTSITGRTTSASAAL